MTEEHEWEREREQKRKENEDREDGIKRVHIHIIIQEAREER